MCHGQPGSISAGVCVEAAKRHTSTPLHQVQTNIIRGNLCLRTVRHHKSKLMSNSAKKIKEKTRKKQAKKKQIKIETWFVFLLFFVLKKTSYKRSNKFPKNRSRFEFFLKNPLEKNKKKTKLVFLCCLLPPVSLVFLFASPLEAPRARKWLNHWYCGVVVLPI